MVGLLSGAIALCCLALFAKLSRDALLPLLAVLIVHDLIAALGDALDRFRLRGACAGGIELGKSCLRNPSRNKKTRKRIFTHLHAQLFEGGDVRERGVAMFRAYGQQSQLACTNLRRGRGCNAADEIKAPCQQFLDRT